MPQICYPPQSVARRLVSRVQAAALRRLARLRQVPQVIDLAHSAHVLGKLVANAVLWARGWVGGWECGGLLGRESVCTTARLTGSGGGLELAA